MLNTEEELFVQGLEKFRHKANICSILENLTEMQKTIDHLRLDSHIDAKKHLSPVSKKRGNSWKATSLKQVEQDEQERKEEKMLQDLLAVNR